MAVGLGLSQKAHGFGLQIHRFAERAERVRILRTIVRRINVVGGTAIFHQFRDDGSRQNFLGDDVRENQVVPRVRSVHHECAAFGRFVRRGWSPEALKWVCQAGADAHPKVKSMPVSVGCFARFRKVSGDPVTLRPPVLFTRLTWENFHGELLLKALQ